MIGKREGGGVIYIVRGGQSEGSRKVKCKRKGEAKVREEAREVWRKESQQ